MVQGKAPPPGFYVGVTAENIGGGDMIEEITEHIQKAFRELRRHERRIGNQKGTATVTAKIKISHMKETSDQYVIDYEVTDKTPGHKQCVLAKVLMIA